MELKKTEISILIPAYNTVCVDFVKQLHQQAEEAEVDYEIIVADDASTMRQCVEENRQILQIPHCQYIVREKNAGAAATRNFLAQKSRYSWLLFLDCDMQLPDKWFLSRYLTHIKAEVINGGISIGGKEELLRSNLRYRYEKAAEPAHTTQRRKQRPYHSFRSTNFLISRNTILSIPFDERFRRSGYEDVFYGKQLRQQHVSIEHIDNPLVMTEFEDNINYVEKTERSLQTLYTFRHELQGYSRLLTLAEGLHVGGVKWCLKLLHKLFAPMERHNLCGNHPNLTIFNLYRIGYYLTRK